MLEYFNWVFFNFDNWGFLYFIKEKGKWIVILTLSSFNLVIHTLLFFNCNVWTSFKIMILISSYDRQISPFETPCIVFSSPSISNLFWIISSFSSTSFKYPFAFQALKKDLYIFPSKDNSSSKYLKCSLSSSSMYQNNSSFFLLSLYLQLNNRLFFLLYKYLAISYFSVRFTFLCFLIISFIVWDLYKY